MDLGSEVQPLEPACLEVVEDRVVEAGDELRRRRAFSNAACQRRNAFRDRKVRKHDVRAPGHLGAKGLAPRLVKLYLDEPGSESLGSEVTGRTDVVLSDLSITECVSALARRVREGTAPPEFVSRLYHAILDHLEAGRFERLDFTPEVHREAER